MSDAVSDLIRRVLSIERKLDILATSEYLGSTIGGSWHPPVTLGGGSDPALALSGQQLTLADVLTPTEHTAIGNSAPHHAPVTLDAHADTLLSLSTQALGLDTQMAGRVLAGPTTGADAVPTFRALAATDIPGGVDHGGLGGLADDDHTQYLLASGARSMAGDLDCAKYKAIAMCCDNGTSFPATPNTGQWYYRTDVDTLFIYEAAWKPIIAFASCDLYVDGTLGSDAVGQGYSSGAGATKTIMYALSNIIPSIVTGDINVMVAAGTYAEDITLPSPYFVTGGYLYLFGAYTEVATGTTTTAYVTSGSTQTGTISTTGSSTTVTVGGGGTTGNVRPGLIVYCTTNKSRAALVTAVASSSQFTIDRALDLSAGYTWGLAGSAYVDSGATWADDAYNGYCVILSKSGVPKTDYAATAFILDTCGSTKSFAIGARRSSYATSGKVYSIISLDVTLDGQVATSFGTHALVCFFNIAPTSTKTRIVASLYAGTALYVYGCRITGKAADSIICLVQNNGILGVRGCLVTGACAQAAYRCMAAGSYLAVGYTLTSVTSYTSLYGCESVTQFGSCGDSECMHLCYVVGTAWMELSSMALARPQGHNLALWMSGTATFGRVLNNSSTYLLTTLYYLYGFTTEYDVQTQTFGSIDTTSALRLTEIATAPSTATNEVKLYAANQNAEAGNEALHILSETGDITSIGNRISTTGGLIVNSGGASAATYDTQIQSDTEANMVYLDASADYVYLGGTTNGVRVGKGGELELIGTATRWEDLRIEPTARNTGTNAPSFEQWADDSGLGDTGMTRGVYLYSFDDAAVESEKELFFTMQLPHAWASTSIYIHVHWIGNVNDTTSAPRWGLEYAWKEIGATFAATTTVYSDGTNYTATTDPNITAGIHYISKFTAIAPGATADGISSIVIGRIFRNSSNAADTYDAAGNKCGLLYVDAHYEVNDFGSTTEYVK